MKKKILLGSLILAGISTLLGLIMALSTPGNEGEVVSTLRLGTIASVLGLGSISTFFVGLAYPKE